MNSIITYYRFQSRLQSGSRSGTHITQDREGFGQSVAQQPDPFGKQPVQMFPEMLTDKEWSGKNTTQQSFKH